MAQPDKEGYLVKQGALPSPDLDTRLGITTAAHPVAAAAARAHRVSDSKRSHRARRSHLSDVEGALVRA